MAVLQTVEKIRKRLSYDDIETVSDAIEAALESATIAIEDSIRTDLARATVQDIFYVIQSRVFSNPVFGSGVSGRTSPQGLRSFAVGASSSTELKLSRGWVDTDETITVVAGNSARNALGTGDGQNFDLKDPDDFTLLDAEQGVMRVQDYDLGGTYVVVNYTAGFSGDGACPTRYVTTGGNTMPGWLVEAASLKATLILNGNPVVRDEALDEAQLQTIQRQLDNILISRSRYAPGSWKPDQSLVTLV